MQKYTVAENRGVTPDITADGLVLSESYWRHEQDIIADLVRQMEQLAKNAVEGDDIWTYQNRHGPMFDGVDIGLSFPNFFITISPLSGAFQCTVRRCNTMVPTIGDPALMMPRALRRFICTS